MVGNDGFVVIVNKAFHLLVIMKVIVCIICVLLDSVLSQVELKYVSKLDIQIRNKLTNPATGEGALMLALIEVYNRVLEDILDNFKRNLNLNDPIILMLIEQRGPICIQHFYNDHLIQAKYGWDPFHVGKLYELLNKVQTRWIDFRLIFEKLGVIVKPVFLDDKVPDSPTNEYEKELINRFYPKLFKR